MPRNLLLEFAPQFEDRTPRDRPAQQTILDALFKSIVQSGVDMFTAGGNALQGKYRRTPETPGQWSDADEAMQQIMENQMAREAWNVGLNMVGSPGLTGGMPGMGSGASRMRYNPLTDPERMAIAQEEAVRKRGLGIPTGKDAPGWDFKRPEAEKGSWWESVAKARAGTRNAISEAQEGYRYSTNPLMSAEDWAEVAKKGFVLGSGTADKASARSILAMDAAARMERAADQGYTIDAYKGLMPYDWHTMPTRNGRGEVISGGDLIPQELRSINTPGQPHAGFFSDSPDVANRFAALFGGPDAGGAVLPAKLKFNNPLVIDAKGKPAAAFQFDSVAREHGTGGDMDAFRSAFDPKSRHDGVILKNTKDEGTVYVTKGADQARSRFAAFDPANEGSGFLLGSGTADKNAAATIQGIRAYHGSPHDFDRFDLSKIGTGEGAQAYGHGLYFAEKEGIARSYRDALTGGADPRDKLTEIIQGWTGTREPGQQATADMVRKTLKNSTSRELNSVAGNDEVVRDIVTYINGHSDDLKTISDPAMSAMKRIDKALPQAPKGHMYEVNINANPEHFLDWDKPLAEQSQYVRDAIAKADPTIKTTAPDLREIKDPEIRSFIRQAMKANEGQAQGLDLAIDNDGRLYEAIVKHAKRNKMDLDALDMRPSDYVYQQAKGFIDGLTSAQGTTGDALGRILGVKGQDAMAAGAAAAKVREAGIPGIRYLDQGSRGAGDGTRNYVVFDDKLIDIVRKYGIGGLSMLPPAAAAFMSHKLKPVDYDPFGKAVDHDPFEDRS